ncbi:hypothetical protein [Streptomyces doebereineriae]|uniref:Uncharacterized protein n=1 Tax=Streptomyces doebereineriae TaxID=3075528 RepID=A0ABU2VHI3_9ACTN|nr:hypothetical protein [Streptomyces sp. DSM 41640]MDT0484705.1 hypothetical protein [Streptomyces sp. DSM 41640]
MERMRRRWSSEGCEGGGDGGGEREGGREGDGGAGEGGGLMAELAGMTLESRHSDWTGEEFTAESRSHVSVYRTAGPLLTGQVSDASGS